MRPRRVLAAPGPTAISLRLKPDISAPGVSILSSVPGGWEAMSGTSMATPQISGAAALLRERHPDWPVATIKAALDRDRDAPSTSTASPRRRRAAAAGSRTRCKADVPLVLASPVVRLVRARPGRRHRDRPTSPSPTPAAAPASGTSPSSRSQRRRERASRSPATVTVPGPLDLIAPRRPGRVDGDLSGFVRLTRGTDVRRHPVLAARVATRRSAARRPRPSARPGLHAGTTSGKPALVPATAIPDVPAGGAVSATLQGPEQVVPRDAEEAGRRTSASSITRARPGVQVEPRVVVAGDENRLTGYPALPVNLNPYLAQFGDPVLAAGAVRPLAGAYDVVFDSPTAAGAGSFTFRYWVNDTTPPKLTLLQPRVSRGTPLACASPTPARASTPRPSRRPSTARRAAARCQNGVIRIPTAALKRGAAPAARAGVGLPGVAEHGERAADPAEHARARRDGSSSAEKPGVRLQPD